METPPNPSVSLEPVDGWILRVHPLGGSWQDGAPYDRTMVVAADKDEPDIAVLKGLVHEDFVFEKGLMVLTARELEKVGFLRAAWDRIKGGPVRRAGPFWLRLFR